MRESWIRGVNGAGVRRLVAVSLLAIGLGASTATAQFGNVPPPEKLVTFTSSPIAARAGETAKATLTLQIAEGWHINANPATPEFMVPTEVDLPPGAGITAGTPVYPLPQKLKLGFEESELSVWDERVTIQVPLAVARDAMNGRRAVVGKIKFQACNDQLCLAPASITFALDVTVSGGRQASQGPEATGAPPESSIVPPTPVADTAAAGIRTERFSTTPPPGGATRAALDNPLTRTIDRGGVAAFLTLFLIGLALNLTPCVYPMLGVTVSIFGARRAAPPIQVFGLALLYVLGMATMYSVLGLVAAFTGGLFGGFLQNPIVLVVIGLLLVGLSLSMFGVYEIQMPAALRERASAVSAVGATGVFLSGLLVGVFAAPCIGPPVVALLAVVGAKGDLWFGFSSFFVLALGLGAPYLVLGTFSNLLRALPRSGDWMEWIKKVFGFVLLALGALYVVLGIAPSLAIWVVPAALVVGGGWLGFFERRDEDHPKRTGFRVLKRVGGVAAVLGGLGIVATTPRQGIPMEKFSPAALAEALASGRPVMIDFSADWCMPCHELERFTFTDRRVIAAARNFTTFRADLTRYDSPDAEAWRKQYAISGVPTVVFLMPDGREVRESRVEGFLKAEPFLERMAIAARGGLRAGATP